MPHNIIIDRLLEIEIPKDKKYWEKYRRDVINKIEIA